MPNHVTNIIRFRGDQTTIDKLFRKIKGKNGVIDFNKIIPTPKNIYQGNLGEKEKKKYGANNWYDWNIYNWGTKWNAYDQSGSRNENEIRFSTAWSAPFPIFDALSKQFSKLFMEIYFADEDTGANCGSFLMQNGDMIEKYHPEEGSKEAINFAEAVYDGDVGMSSFRAICLNIRQKEEQHDRPLQECS